MQGAKIIFGFEKGMPFSRVSETASLIF